MFSLPSPCLHISISLSRRKETASIPHDDPHDFSQVMNRSEIPEKPRGPIHCTAAPPILNGGGEIMIIMARRSLLNSGPEFLGKRASERERE